MRNSFLIIIVCLVFVSAFIVSTSFSNFIIFKENKPITLTESIVEDIFGIRIPIFSSYELIEFADDDNSVVIYPIFTQAAYNKNGFYDYYAGNCDEKCLTINLDNNRNNTKFTSSKIAIWVFEDLKWNIVSDLEIHQNPSILQSYDKVILLHNEYVTRNIFDAITTHPNVIFLYPNALYAEVEYDSSKDTITLVRGHGFPDREISNGFDWKYDNTHPYEYDIECKDWEFYKIENGFMLNCYPENIIMYDRQLLREIKDL